MMQYYYISDESAMFAFAQKFAQQSLAGLSIYLKGDLGVGKTTFVRGILRAKGYDGLVKSPTYTLVESYDDVTPKIYHFDLYRLLYPEELEDIGMKDYFQSGSCCFIEWPEKGEPWLPIADLDIHFIEQSQGRKLTLQANSAAGSVLLTALAAQYNEET